MPEDLYLPHPIGDLYRNRDTGEEVVLVYKSGWMYDSTPGAEDMLPSYTHIDGEGELITYPQTVWEEMYEPVPVNIQLFDELET